MNPRRTIAITILFLIGAFCVAQDAILEQLLIGKDLSRSWKLIDSMGKIAKQKDPSSGIYYADKRIEVSRAFKNDTAIARALWQKGISQRKRGEFDEAEKLLTEAEMLFNKFQNPDWIVTINCDLGNVFMLKGLHEAALIKYQKALSLSTKYNRQDLVGPVFANMGNLYSHRGDFENALTYYKQGYDYYEKKRDSLNMALTMDNMGLVHGKRKKYELALRYHFEALKFIERIKDKNYAAESYLNIGVMFIEMGDYANAQKYLTKAQEIYTRLNSSFGTTILNINFGEIELKKKNFAKAAEILEKGYPIAKEVNSFELMESYAINLSKSYEGLNKPDKALAYYKEYVKLKDTIMNIESTKQINELTEKYESKQKQTEIDLLTKDNLINENTIKQNKTVTISLIIGILITLAMLSAFYFRYKDKQKAHRLLEEKNKAIEEQKKIVEEKNSEITDSINYAKRLQSAILPSEELLKSNFNDLFFLYMPKDIVSGDFYWYSESEHNKILAVADCTGHGVPGGFMSMLGYESLQDVALRREITTTSQALNSLDQKITQALNKSDRAFRDGMDIALVAIDKRKNTLQFSGANRPLILVRNGELTEFKPDKLSIGGNIDDSIKPYATHTVEYEMGDVFYMFTDGYADQFGGPDEKKFKYKNLLQTIHRIHQLPMHTQKKELETIYLQWKGKLEQIDDVCIVGFKM